MTTPPPARTVARESDAAPSLALLREVARRADALARWRVPGPEADRRIWLRAECEILDGREPPALSSVSEKVAHEPVTNR